MRFALDLANIAAAEILPLFPGSILHHKMDGSIVTDADLAAEKAMRRRIQEVYPSHGVLGEEEGELIGSDMCQWVLDPIDGTRAFTLGVPMFGTLVGLLDHGVPRLGVIHFPITGETMYAETGNGCWYQRGPIDPVSMHVNQSVSRVEDASISLWGVDCSELREGNSEHSYHLQSVIQKAHQLEFLGGCVQHFQLAKGALHAALDAVMHPWDVAAVVPCIREAGGVVSTLGGDYENVVFGGSLLSSSNRQLHEHLVRLINDNVKDPSSL
jgi:histidinol-phosphatase